MRASSNDDPRPDSLGFPADAWPSGPRGKYVLASPSYKGRRSSGPSCRSADALSYPVLIGSTIRTGFSRRTTVRSQIAARLSPERGDPTLGLSTKEDRNEALLLSRCLLAGLAHFADRARPAL